MSTISHLSVYLFTAWQLEAKKKQTIFAQTTSITIIGLGVNRLFFGFKFQLGVARLDKILNGELNLSRSPLQQLTYFSSLKLRFDKD